MNNQLNKINTKAVLILSALVLIVGLSSLKNNSIISDWKAPASADKIINPIKITEPSINIGKKLYTTYCAACHGNKGKGDGLAAASLNPKPANFTLDKIQNQTDGAIYWKLTEGRSPMAGYKGSLSDEQRWHLVNFIRTLKK